jgi:hypothetical protein
MAKFFGIEFKNKAEREKEYQEYANKIFPYGEPQRQKIMKLLTELWGNERVNPLMMHYILLKEAVIDSEDKDYDAAAAKIEKKRIVMLNPELRECIRILIFKDLAMDEGLEYPTAEELKSMASERGTNS